MNLIQEFGRKAPNAAMLAPKGAVFGGDYEDFLARANAQVRAAVPSQKVALSIPVTSFLKGETKTIELQPQVDFKGERLVLTNSGPNLGQAGFFSVNSVKVGRDEQLVSPNAIAGDAFSQTTQRVIGLNMKTCPTSLKIYVELTNHATTTQNISGMFVGSCGGCNESACGVADPSGSATYDPLVPIGIPRTTVTAGSTTTIEIQPQVFFTGQQLVIASSIVDTPVSTIAVADTSKYFTIDSVKVGRDEQLLSTDPLAASLFASNGQMDIGLSMKGCPTSLKIYVTVTNKDGTDHVIEGSIFGFCGENGNCNTGLCSVDVGIMASRPAAQIPAGVRNFGLLAQPAMPAIR